jgi:acetyl esterase/lipase
LLRGPVMSGWTPTEQRTQRLVRSFVKIAVHCGLPWIRNFESKVLNLSPAAQKVPLTTVEIAGISCASLERPGLADPPVLLYLHGGGYCLGSSRTYREIEARFAHDLDLRVIAPDYRLAPEHPYPAALDDCTAVYEALASQIGAKRIVIAGDSAGGALVLATLLHARERGLEQPAGALLYSPWVDPWADPELGSMLRNRAFDAVDLPFLELCRDSYIPPDRVAQARQDPRMVPLRADLSGLAPALVQVGELELFLDQSEELVQLWRSAGGEVELRHGKLLFHTFQNHFPSIRRSEPLVAESVAFVAQRLGLAAPARAGDVAAY